MTALAAQWIQFFQSLALAALVVALCHKPGET
jgi:hypothetical protein